MILLLVRHAEAEVRAASDFERRLTAKGRKQAKALGKLLRKLRLPPTRIATSPFLRAVETAEILHERLKAKCEVARDDRLRCGMTPQALVEVLRDAAEATTILLVGHEPDFSAALAALLGSDKPECFDMKKGACACLEVHEPKPGGAVLHWLLPPKIATKGIAALVEKSPVPAKRSKKSQPKAI